MDLKLEELPGRYAIARLTPDAPIPDWVRTARIDDRTGLSSITRSDQELSIVAPQSDVPEGDDSLRIERDWIAWRVVGQLDFNLVGVLSSLTGVLAEVGVSVFTLSTFDTDYVLVRRQDEYTARQALARFL